MKKLFLLLTVIITFAISMAAQDQRVTGVVVNADDGEPIVGATVMGVGTKIGVTTGIDGDFSLVLPASAKKLSVSFVGMKTHEVNITPGKMTISLEGSNVLDEVISVAYGTQKRSAFTGSASVLDASQIESVQVSNPVDALQGRVAGVQLNNINGAPGSSDPTIYIRGISSINAGTKPLIVIDGTPYAGDLNTISNQDIESMTVLKDAASNALYGARGANGVILITTKKGKGTDGARVTLDAKWGSNSRAIPNYDVIDTAAGYYGAYATAIANRYGDAFGIGKLDEAGTLAQINDRIIQDLKYQVYNVPQGEDFIVSNGGRFVVNPNATLGNVVSYNGQEYLLRPDNWDNESFRNSLRQEYNLSVANSNDKSSFFFSANYLNNEGITSNSGFERLNTRLSAEIQAKPWLKIGANANYSHYNSSNINGLGDTGVDNIFYVSNTMAPIYPVYIRDGQGAIMRDENGILMYDYGEGLNAGLTRPIMAQANPIGSNALDVDKSNGNSFNGNASAEIRLPYGFRFTTNNAVSLDETRFNSVTNPYYGGYAEFNGMVTVEHQRFFSATFQQLLNWSQTYGKNNISVLLGHENYSTKTYDLYASAQNMLLPSNTELSGCITDTQNGSEIIRYNNEGWLSRVNYDYDGKYFGSASFRRDASSRFHPDHRWGNFWSVGGAWIISKENFLADQTWIDMLKIKASYGEQGNDNIGNYLYTNRYSIINSNGQPAAQPSTVMGNPEITWEKGGNFNAGVDFSFFGERLTGTFEGFIRKTSDMLFTRPLPLSYGYRSQYCNVGDMTNKGVELELHGDFIRTKDITVGMSFNLTHYKNKITRLIDSSKNIECDGVMGYSSGSFFFGEGESIYTFRMPTYAGVDPETGMPRYVKAVQKVDDAGNPVKDAAGNPVYEQTYTTNYTDLDSSIDYHLQGTALPKVYGGFGIYGNLYGFDFSVDFTYQLGGKIYDSAYAQLMSPPTQTSQSSFHKDILDAWTPIFGTDDAGQRVVTGHTGSQPRFVYGDQNFGRSSSRFLVSSNYLSLQAINVGYTLPKKITRKMFLDKVRVYFSADNVALWSKRKGLDPRTGLAQGYTNGVRDQNITGSSQNGYYSPIRTLSGGINVTF